jgi:hypothetical protein
MTAAGTTRRRIVWGVLWRSDSRLDGKREVLKGDPDAITRTLLFETRAGARAYVHQWYSYIANRPDLQAEPHGWKMPKVVRVALTAELVA